MLSLEVPEQGSLRAGFIFPPEFIGFQGHFPEGRVLPGVCHIQCVAAMLERHKGAPVRLKEIVSAKFLAPVLPSETITVNCRGVDGASGELVVKASVSRGETVVADLKLKVSLAA